MRKTEYYCDCCGKKVKSESNLHWIDVVFGATEGFTEEEVCIDCLSKYYNELGKIANKMFKD